MKLQKVYHMGIPVDNLDRAKDFYTNVLGMEYLGRAGGKSELMDTLVAYWWKDMLKPFDRDPADIQWQDLPLVELDGGESAK